MSDFTDQYGPLARDIAKATGLQPSVVLAIIDHETGGGAHISNNNLFGMMDNKSQPRQYADKGGSGLDFVNLMKGPRFSKALTFTDPVDQAQAISNLGYGPGPADAAAHPDQAAGAAYANSLITKAKGYHQAGFTNDPPMTADDAMKELQKIPGAIPPPPGQVQTQTAPPAEPPMTADDAMKELQAIPGAVPPPAAIQNPIKAPTGLGPNMLAGAAEGAAGLVNVLHDPFGNLVGKPLLMAGGFAHDALAPYLGYNRLTPEQRSDLLNDSFPQPGTAAIDNIARKAGVPTPGQVVPSSTLDTLARKATTGAIGGAPFGPLAASSMAGGAIIGDRAAAAAPDWAKPAVELGANVLASGGIYKGADRFVTKPPTAGYEFGPTAADRADRYYPDGTASVVPRGPEDVPMTINVPPMDVQRAYVEYREGGGTLGPDEWIRSQTGPQPNSAGAAATPLGERGTYPPDPKLEARIADAARLDHERTLLNQTPANRVNAQGWDTTQYVPGSVPSKAEYTGDSRIALQQRADLEHPDQAARWQGQEEQNNAARKQFFQNESGSAPTLLQQKLDLAAKYQPKYDNLWLNEKPVDPGMIGDVSDHINSVIAGPDGKTAPVKSTLKTIEAKLHVGDDPSAPLETSPEQLFGVRQEVTRLLGATARRADPNLADPRVSYRLNEIKEQLDNAIESGAKGYKDVQSGYHQDSIPIDKQELLQSYAKDLYNDKGMMTLHPVQTMMEDIVTQRGMPGANQAKSLSYDDMSKLWDLRNDLQRRSNIDLGKARGSNTAQTLQTLRTFLPDMVGQAATVPVHLAFNHLVGDPMLNYMGLAGQTAFQGYRVATQAARARAARVDDYLNPPPGWQQVPPVTPAGPRVTPTDVPGINGWNKWQTGP